MESQLLIAKIDDTSAYKFIEQTNGEKDAEMMTNKPRP